MTFRQLFHPTSGTYTYLLGCEVTRKAAIIDPVSENTKHYITLLEQLSFDLIYAIDTHTHADHITSLGALRDATGCQTLMGELSEADCVSRKVKHGEQIPIGTVSIKALYTPGHTIESFSFYVEGMVFTGDLLLIRGTGRTDFQGGDAGKSWDSIQDQIFTLPDCTLVYPGHDYKGWTVSTVAEEKAYNPRVAGKSREQYIRTMNNLNLPDPKMMDVAVPANLRCGNV